MQGLREVVAMALWWVRCAVLAGLVVLGAGIGSQRLPAQEADDIAAQQRRVRELFAQKNYGEALTAQRALAKRVDQIEMVATGKQGPRTADALGNLAWYALFERAFGEALAAAERAHSLAPELLWIEINRAHALLFVGHTDDARALYLAHRGKRPQPNSDEIWEDLVAEDIATLGEAGIDHAAFGEIVGAFGIDRSVAKGQIDALNVQVRQMRREGRYNEALSTAERYVELARQRYGDERLPVATAVDWLATAYQDMGRYAEAEPLFIRALAITEKALGPHHADVGQPLDNLAGLYKDMGRYTEAEQLLQRAVTIREEVLGPGHPDVAISLTNLAGLYQRLGRYAEAEQIYGRTIAVFEKTNGSDDEHLATALNNLAGLYQDMGRYTEAEPYLKRSLGMREKTLGPDHPDVSTSLNNLARLYRNQGRYAEAEPLYKRSLAITEKTLGLDHPLLATVLNNLAGLYKDTGRPTDAEPLLKRSLSILEKALHPDHPDIGRALNNLATLYRLQGRYGEAEPLFKRSVLILEKALGPDDLLLANSLNNLGELYRVQGRYGDAEPYLKRSLAIREKMGPYHPDVGHSLNDLAGLYRAQGNNNEAERLYRRTVSVFEALGADHPNVAAALDNLAKLSVAQGLMQRAANSWRQATAIVQRRAERGLAGPSGGSANGEAQQKAEYFAGLVKTTHRVAAGGSNEKVRRTIEMFETAQWSLGSEAAASLAQMSSRSATSSPRLAALVRERQDLVAEWQSKDKLLIAAKSEPPVKRNAVGEQALSERLAAIDARLAEIDAGLAKDFPAYASLASPKPISVADVQADLREDEALVLFLDTDAGFNPLPEETFLWVVTRRKVRWVRSELGTQALADGVAALRCGLDAALWDDSDAVKRCRNLVQGEPTRDAFDSVLNETLPFDVARAHALYKALFGQVEDLIRNKHLLIVPSGPLTQLPFQVLVTAEAKGNDMRGTWLTRRHAITVLPAVASLKALRRITKPSAATKPMIGFGNPLLDGNPAERPWEMRWAAMAREKICRGLVTTQQVAEAKRKTRGVLHVAMRDGHADPADLRTLVPLPDTADELCTVARELHLSADDILLGAKATETAIKTLSSEGKLAQYHALHFATHGTLAGEIAGTSEPGLVLTPPKEVTDIDDGYLSASEVATLKLDADWVVLSACNTAAGGAKGAEALSGLARAFIYAGARALLVSHWAVDSAATVKLVTTAVGATTRDAKLGRAEALRRAMLAMIDGSDPRQAHPSFWAPFVVVGEGSAAKQ
jgi:CHAT domain-containing protein/tetratricopeptide (TPR) repeat protein